METFYMYPNIAFDFDGVFVPDIVFNDNNELSLLLSIRTRNIRPLFVPKKPYSIITGRPVEDKPDTLYFITEYMSENLPTLIFHENKNGINNIEYKYNTLLENTFITKYYESCPDQVKELRYRFSQVSYRDLEIIYWNDFINQNI